MAVLEKISNFLNRVLVLIAGSFLAAMIILTCANIFFRIVWMPVRGTYELLGYFGAIVTAFALGYTQQRKGHIAVDILVLGFSKRRRRILDCINSALCMIFFGMVTWQITKYATTLYQTGEVTETLRIIYYPFTYGVAAGCLVLSLVFLTEFLKSLAKERETES
ncbi:MAG: TRAP transporter small permease [Deltaproteobacteria bacterium]|nr:TRAP transporter small permease [Deltaproteobacteria bacterium]